MSERAEFLKSCIDCEDCLGNEQCLISKLYGSVPNLGSIDISSAERLIKELGLGFFKEPWLQEDTTSVVGYCFKSYEEEIGHPIGELDNEGVLAVRRENCGWVQFIFKKEDGHEDLQPTDPSPPAARVLI